jgi:hypothetical protein
MKINTLFKRAFLFVMLAASANGAFATSTTYYSKCDASVATGERKRICIHHQRDSNILFINIITKAKFITEQVIILGTFIIFMLNRNQVLYL